MNKCVDFLCNKVLFCKINKPCYPCEKRVCNNCLRKENCKNANQERKYCFVAVDKN